MVKPTASGLTDPEIEYASASRLKLRARSSGPPISPVTRCVASWKTMNARPTIAALAHSTGRLVENSGSTTPTASPAAPKSIGIRTPMRSDRRPAATAVSIGRSA